LKISVVGGGNAACITALHYGFWMRHDESFEVELIHDPSKPVERVGQATLLQQPNLMWAATGLNWYNNPMHATFKSGILYEGWGKKNDKVFHDFPLDSMAMHFCPWEMQRYVLESGLFKVTEGEVDPKDIDADYVFDCRGKPKDFSDYEELINPTNACILGKPKWDTTKAFWSRHVATPDGWTFVIPTHLDSSSHDYCVGYCYNSDITPPNEARGKFLSQFDVEVKKHIKYKNYVAKNPIDDRIILNGNRLYFLEPLESSSVQTYLEWARFVFDWMINNRNSSRGASHLVKKYIKQNQNFVLWHYHFGSKYDTPFWNYAKTLTFEDDHFDQRLETIKKMDALDVKPTTHGGFMPSESDYGQWHAHSFKVWYNGMTNKYF